MGPRFLDEPRVIRLLSAVGAQRADIVTLVDERNSLRQKSYYLAQGSGNRPKTSAKVAVYEHPIADLEAKIAALTAHFNLALGAISVDSAWLAGPAR